jgi:hypothetical protein
VPDEAGCRRRSAALARGSVRGWSWRGEPGVPRRPRGQLAGSSSARQRGLGSPVARTRPAPPGVRGVAEDVGRRARSIAGGDQARRRQTAHDREKAGTRRQRWVARRSHGLNALANAPPRCDASRRSCSGDQGIRVGDRRLSSREPRRRGWSVAKSFRILLRPGIA